MTPNVWRIESEEHIAKNRIEKEHIRWPSNNGDMQEGRQTFDEDSQRLKVSKQVAQPSHNINSTDSQEASRHDTPHDHYINHDSPLSGDGSHEASRPDTTHDQYRSNESPKSRDALSIFNVVVRLNPIQPGASKHDTGRSHVQLTRNDGQLDSQSLSRAQVDIVVNTMVKNHLKEVHQYRSLEKRELIIYYLGGVAIGICKRRAEPNMLDTALCVKLDKVTLVTTKGKMQQEGIQNRDT
ncbi:hypothetical protein Cgig2_009197 [Carnegiea gigantea]|uniref:Uncharacterized protein n=1 Tax=Carnegiea gigantea TaxID=171969 RepID=A0A9Q1GQZ9_9CARY|nr:hypothetical protein Cgig2_009197 [Carnegiea gigantea]